MQKFSTYIAIVLFGLLIVSLNVPMSVFAVQSGVGYIVYDQINNAPSVISGNGFTNKSGGSFISSNMSGGGFISFGGAYRSSAETTPPPPPPPTPSVSGGGGGQTSLPSNIITPIAPIISTSQENNNVVVFNPTVGQPQNIDISKGVGTAGVGTVSLKESALLDIVIEPIKEGQKNINALFIISIIVITLTTLWLFFIVRQRLQKSSIKKLIKTERPTSYKKPDSTPTPTPTPTTPTTNPTEQLTPTPDLTPKPEDKDQKS